MPHRPIATAALSLALLLAPITRAAEPAAPPADGLTAEVARLRAEVESLKRELAAIREQLASTAPATKPAPPPPPAPAANGAFTLGPEAKLGAYKYQAPADWTSKPAPNQPLGVLYYSPDKQAVLFVVVRPKAAVGPEIQPKYAQKVIQELKQSFLASKTEVIEPPTIQPDPRFFLKFRERIKGKANKVADQTHVYHTLGKDLVELTVITTAEASDQVAATQKFAEDVLLTFKPQ